MAASKSKPVYEDFEVRTEWVHEVADDTLIAHLPGFTKAQLKVQVITGGILRIFGERPIDGNKFSQFSKDIPIPSNCDQMKIKANFKASGLLHVKFPKLIVQAQAGEQKQVQAAESDQKPAPQPPVPQKQNYGVEEAPPKVTMEKQSDKSKEVEKEPDKEKAREDKSNVTMALLKYKSNVVEVLAKGLKNPRKMMNIVLAVLLVVVLAVYLRNTTRSLRNY
ncbi:hypothetical protein PTKIN_Ptkin11bG0071600 [Pterospermum kingtungense]